MALAIQALLIATSTILCMKLPCMIPNLGSSLVRIIALIVDVAVIIMIPLCGIGNRVLFRLFHDPKRLVKK